jgi:hypothetical protein
MKTKSIGLLGVALLMIAFSSGPRALAQSMPSATNANAANPPSWKTYSNPDFHLNFSYPEDWNLVVSTAKPEFIILLLYKGPAKSAGSEDLRIDAYKNSKPADENSDPDAHVAKYNAELTLGPNNWKVFNEPLRPTRNTIPFYFLRKVQNTILYVVSAQNALKLNPMQTQIVSSIRFQ